MRRIIRWGIWGTGSIARVVASDFQLVPEAVLHAVASRNEERAKEFAAEHGVRKWYVGLDALIQDAEVDVVYVATPNHCHLEDCLACLHAGKAVLCEKPLALDLAQAELIANAARRHKVFCMEAMWTRFIPAVQEAKRSIDAGRIGPVRMIQGNFAYPAARKSDSRLFDINAGGGALLDRGVYLISLVQHLMGVPDSIRGMTVLGPTGVDELSSYQLSFRNGALADLVSGLVVRGTNEVVFSGERGMMRLSAPFYCAHRLVVEPSAPRETEKWNSTENQGGARKFVRRLRTQPALKSLRRRLDPVIGVLQQQVKSFPFPGSGYQFELREVNRCLRENLTESPTMPLNDSLEVLRTMDRLRALCGLIYPQEFSELQNR